jgi:hypothetical protein
MNRTSYPIPPGYRMLSPGEMIKENDAYWSGEEFTQVPKNELFSGTADPARHPCLIRADAAYVEPDAPEEKRSDMIRPDYYKQGGIEVTGIIRAWKLGFNLGNVLKYILRAGLKSTDRLADLRKANTYLQFELDEEKEKAGE